jgi:hypothetical protein
VQIVSMTANNEATCHVGPRRQVIATIAGEGELETGDGQKLTVKPGVLTLIDDLTGKGHLTRNGLKDASACSCRWTLIRMSNSK